MYFAPGMTLRLFRRSKNRKNAALLSGLAPKCRIFCSKKPPGNRVGRLATLTAARQRGARKVKVASNAPSLKY